MMDLSHWGPTLKLVGPESYNQVTRCLALQRYSGVYKCTVQQEPQLNLMSHPHPRYDRSSLHTTPEQDHKKNWGHGHCLPKSWRCWRRGCGRWTMHRPRQIPTGLDVWPSVLVWWWTDWILAPTLPTDGWERNHNSATGMPPFVDVALVFCHPSHVLPSHPNQHGNRVMVAIGPRGK